MTKNKTIRARIQHPFLTAAALAAANPLLLTGEVAYESDTRRHKVGDGATAWCDLPYADVSLPGTIPAAASPIPGYTNYLDSPIEFPGASFRRFTIEFKNGTVFPLSVLNGKRCFMEAEISYGKNTGFAIPVAIVTLTDELPVSPDYFVNYYPAALENERISILRRRANITDEGVTGFDCDFPGFSGSLSSRNVIIKGFYIQD